MQDAQVAMIKTIRSQQGQTLVEFALILPLLLILVFGIVEFAIIFYDKAVVTNASREGARRGSVASYTVDTGAYDPLDLSEVQSAVSNYLSGRIIDFASGSSTTSVCWASVPTGPWDNCISPPPAQPSPPGSNYLRVVVSYPYSYLVLPNFLGGNPTINLSAETIMRME